MTLRSAVSPPEAWQRARVALAVCALSALVVSCARQLPDSPAPTASSRRLARPACNIIRAPDSTVVVTLKSGVDATQFGSDYFAALVESDGEGSALYQPGAGLATSLLALQ